MKAHPDTSDHLTPERPHGSFEAQQLRHAIHLLAYLWHIYGFSPWSYYDISKDLNRPYKNAVMLGRSSSYGSDGRFTETDIETLERSGYIVDAQEGPREYVLTPEGESLAQAHQQMVEEIGSLTPRPSEECVSQRIGNRVNKIEVYEIDV